MTGVCLSLAGSALPGSGGGPTCTMLSRLCPPLPRPPEGQPLRCFNWRIAPTLCLPTHKPSYKWQESLESGAWCKGWNSLPASSLTDACQRIADVLELLTTPLSISTCSDSVWTQQNIWHHLFCYFTHVAHSKRYLKTVREWNVSNIYSQHVQPCV